MGELYSSNSSENWCTISPACTVELNLEDLEFIVYPNTSNATDCSVPFCPTILSYSIDNSKYATLQLLDMSLLGLLHVAIAS